jgi:hypothetical protein
LFNPTPHPEQEDLIERLLALSRAQRLLLAPGVPEAEVRVRVRVRARARARARARVLT